ncbi:unnamed protein product, partial [Scytosiphon promiscuus]
MKRPALSAGNHADAAAAAVGVSKDDENGGGGGGDVTGPPGALADANLSNNASMAMNSSAVFVNPREALLGFDAGGGDGDCGKAVEGDGGEESGGAEDDEDAEGRGGGA